MKYLFLALLFCTGCQMIDTSDYEVPFEGRKGVVIGFLSPEHGLRVYAGATKAPLSSRSDTLQQVEWSFTEGQNRLKSPSAVPLEPKLWQTDSFYPVAGKNYQLTLRATGISPITSQAVTLPERVSLARVQVLKDVDTFSRRVTCLFKDPVGTHFYTIKVLQYHNDTLLASEPEILPNASDLFVDDVGVSGEWIQKELAISLERSAFRWANRLKVRLYVLDKQGYLFLKSCADNLSLEGNIFTVPVSVYSNMAGGHGCLGTYDFVETDIRW